jgi:glycosyltransferase involved in cell wall biosynthesis
MRIAAFMVVKNDAFYVQMALRSVLPHVVGVYIQDQGSTDGTVQAIRAMACDKIVADFINTGLPRFDKEYNEPRYRTIAVEECERIFKPDWILKLDADEIYTEHFFRSLETRDLSDVNAVRVAGDRFISRTHRSVHPSAIEVSPAGVPFVDPHTQLWRAGMGVKYVSNPAFVRFHPVLSPDPVPQLWLPGVCNIHLHRTFGPKAVAFWQEGGEKAPPGPPYHPPTMFPAWYNSGANMGNAEEIAFEWPDYVLREWDQWGTW